MSGGRKARLTGLKYKKASRAVLWFGNADCGSAESWEDAMQRALRMMSSITAPRLSCATERHKGQTLAARQKRTQEPRAECFPLPLHLGPLQCGIKPFPSSMVSSSPSHFLTFPLVSLPQPSLVFSLVLHPTGSQLISSLPGHLLIPGLPTSQLRHLPRFPLQAAGGRSWPSWSQQKRLQSRIMN